MSDTPETRAERRRRWVTLGEVLAVVAVLISALTLWNSYRERADAESARQAEERRTDTRVATLLLRATPAEGGARLSLAPVNGEQSIQSQSIRFPSALKLTPVDTTGDARIEARWFGDALKAARKAAGLKDDAAGDARLPVVLTTRYLADGAEQRDTALYMLGYRMQGRFLGGSAVRLRGLSLEKRLAAREAQRALDSRWPAR